MNKSAVFAIGMSVGALAYPVGVIVANLLQHRSILYPH